MPFCGLPPLLTFLMILRCFDCYEINLEHVFKAQKVTHDTFLSISKEMLSPEPSIWSQKGLEGLQNSMVPCEFSLFRHVVDFATPPYVFKVFRSPFWPLWAPTSHNSMISSRNVTFFAYKYKPDLDPKGEVRKGHAKGALNHYHLCTFATENHKNAPSQNAYFRNGILSFLGTTFRKTSPESIWSSLLKQKT